MKLPIRWLKKYIECNLSAEKLEEMLTMSGTKVEAVEKKGDEVVIELEVTTNRPDCLSILGLAHEMSALTGKKVTLPSAYKNKEKAKPSRAKSRDQTRHDSRLKHSGMTFGITIEDKKACPLYTGRLIQNVTVKSSPLEAKELLELTGTRAISNVVDATNFVLFESGQPLHAFDFDKIKGAKIIVRYARKGEKFLGIDGIEYTLDEKTLVVADVERAIAIAGVIGGKLTEVTHATKNVLLEAAYFDPALVRQAARKCKISTDSSYRFERGVDPAGVASASRRASELILEWAGGQEVSGLVEKGSLGTKKLADIVLRVGRVEKILGMKVSQKRIVAILKALSIAAKVSGKDKILVQPSSYRRDISQEEDLVEEILRIEGFEKIPTLIPSTRYGIASPESLKAVRTPGIKKFMEALGFSEIITYSLMSAKVLKDAGFDLEKAHRVVNTTSAAQEFFRPLLLPGMLEAAVFNIHRKAAGLKLFEVGNCYQDNREVTVLGLLIYGSFENNWQRKSDASFYDLKGIVANVLQFIGAQNASWKDADQSMGLDQTVNISQEGLLLARVGCVSAAVLKNFDIPHQGYYAEIILDEILARPLLAGKVKPVSKFPVVRRDLAFIADETISVVELQELMKSSAQPNLREVVLFDQYIGRNIAPGKRSLAFSLAYQKETGTFTDSEIQSLQENVGRDLKSRYAVEFR